MIKDLKKIPLDKLDRIIEMAWEDRTTFDAIEAQFKIKEQDVIKIMRNNLKPKSFRLWRERVQGRKTKHLKIRETCYKVPTRSKPNFSYQNILGFK